MRSGRAAWVVPVLPSAQSEPTLAMALGGAGFRLVDLVALYGGLARGGEAIAVRHQQVDALSGRAANRRPLLSPVASWYITDILKDAPPPASAKAGSIAYKTGTSYGYRDAWAIGYDGRHTVGVWIGRADGGATPGLSGRVSAAPILFDSFARIGTVRSPLAPPPPGAVRTSGAQLPPPLKRFAEADGEREQGPFLEPSVAIAFPPDRSELELDSDEPVLTLKADGGALPLTWLADGAPIELDGTRREVQWQPSGRGFVKLSVIDAKGRVDRVTVRLR
jgi:penicillin-binding protein 1C